MPSKSTAQQALMAIAAHTPEKVKGKNKGVLRMTHQQLEDYARTPTAALPRYKSVGQRGPKK